MTKRYLKLAYTSVILALFICIISSLFQQVHINVALFNLVVNILVGIQVSGLIYHDVKYVIEYAKERIVIFINVFIPMKKIVYKNRLFQNFFSIVNINKLNVIRC